MIFIFLCVDVFSDMVVIHSVIATFQDLAGP